MFAAAARNQNTANTAVATVTDLLLAFASNFALPKQIAQTTKPATMMIRARMFPFPPLGRRSGPVARPILRIGRGPHPPQRVSLPRSRRDLEIYLHSQLCGKRNPHRGSRPEEIAKRAGRHQQLIGIGDGHVAGAVSYTHLTLPTKR